MSAEPIELQLSLFAEQGLRALRHEVGDLLQVVYASVALAEIELLPAHNTRKLLQDLKQRANITCRFVDMVYDLYRTVTVQRAEVDFCAFTEKLLATWTVEYNKVVWVKELPGYFTGQADTKLLSMSLNYIASYLARRARLQVMCTLSRSDAQVSWKLQDDGPALTSERIDWLFVPWLESHASALALELPLAAKIVHELGGTITAQGSSNEGLAIVIDLPC